MEIRALQATLLERLRTERAPSPTPLADEVASLFDQLRAPLLRYLSCFGLPSQDGEEVVQEVFLALFKHLQRNGCRAHLRGWIFRVAHNLGLKRCNANRAELKLFSPSSDQDSEHHLNPDPNPEEQWAIHRRQQRLLAVVRALPDQDRRCLYLRAEGLKYREIAEVLGISLGGVAASVARSLSRLSRADEF